MDPSEGPEQQFTIDCEVCCRPMAIFLTIAPDGEVMVQAEPG